MKYISIDPTDHSIEFFDAKSFEAALTVVGLTLGQIDHGSLARSGPGRLCIVSDEHSFFNPNYRFFSVEDGIGTHAFAGPILVYAVDGGGNTISMDDFLLDEKFPYPISWYDTPDEFEAAIRANKVMRPRHAFHSGNTVSITWAWPQPMPEYLKGK